MGLFLLFLISLCFLYSCFFFFLSFRRIGGSFEWEIRNGDYEVDFRGGFQSVISTGGVYIDLR